MRTCGCQSDVYKMTIQYCSQLSDSVQKLKETSENKNISLKLKQKIGMMCQQKVQKQEFCDSVCYKIPYFTDSTFSHNV